MFPPVFLFNVLCSGIWLFWMLLKMDLYLNQWIIMIETNLTFQCKTILTKPENNIQTNQNIKRSVKKRTQKDNVQITATITLQTQMKLTIQIAPTITKPYNERMISDERTKGYKQSQKTA